MNVCGESRQANGPGLEVGVVADRQGGVHQGPGTGGVGGEHGPADDGVALEVVRAVRQGGPVGLGRAQGHHYHLRVERLDVLKRHLFQNAGKVVTGGH